MKGWQLDALHAMQGCRQRMEEVAERMAPKRSLTSEIPERCKRTRRALLKAIRELEQTMKEIEGI